MLMGYAANGSEFPFPIIVDGVVTHVVGLPSLDAVEPLSSDAWLLVGEGADWRLRADFDGE